MNMEDFIEQIICDRIGLLMKERPEELKERDMELCQCQEILVKGLAEETRISIEHFLDELTVQSGEDNRYLYLAGINDGIYLAKVVLQV